MTMAKRDTYTPDSLLAVAVEVFIERGYDGTSMEHLSKAAGISKSSIYHHVRSKEELLHRAISRALDGLFGVLGEPGALEGRAIERLEYVGWFNTPLVYVYCHKVIPTDSIGLHWPIVRIKFQLLVITAP